MALRILVVDDSPISRKLVRRALPPDLEFIVDEAASGAEAVEQYSSDRPDLVIMDLIMPGMNGTEAIRQIVALDADARIVALTSDIQKTTEARLEAAGARQVLHKPVRATELGRAIRTHVARLDPG